MAEVFQLGPVSYTVSAAVTAGQLVMADTSNVGLVKPATAATPLVIGVARDAAAPAGSGSATDFGTLRPEVAVYGAPYEVKVLVGGATDVPFGTKVIAGAAGTVVPVGAAAALDGTTVVGYCTEPAGIVAGARGRIKLV